MRAKKKKSQNIFKIIFYILVLFAVLYLLFNATARKIVSRHIEHYKLSSDYENLLKANEKHKKELKYMESEPVYMERIVKSELNLIAEGEVEYHFNNKKTETNKDEINN